MNETERAALATLIRSRRQELGISGSELARRAGIDKGLLTLLDQHKIKQPRVETLRALAGALEIPLGDLYSATNWLPETALPSLRPYMRAKYEHLPDEAVTEVEAMIEALSQRYRTGPRDGEDE